MKTPNDNEWLGPQANPPQGHWFKEFGEHIDNSQQKNYGIAERIKAAWRVLTDSRLPATPTIKESQIIVRAEDTKMEMDGCYLTKGVHRCHFWMRNTIGNDRYWYHLSVPYDLAGSDISLIRFEFEIQEDLQKYYAEYPKFDTRKR